MDYSKFIALNQMEESISIRRVKACSGISHFCDGGCSYIVHMFFIYVWYVPYVWYVDGNKGVGLTHMTMESTT